MKILKALLALLLVPSLALADTSSQFATMLNNYTILPGLVAGGSGGIQANTDDGTDSAQLCMSGGGGSVSAICANTRGGAFISYGNEAGAAPGGVQLRAGDVANSVAYLDLTNATSLFQLRSSASADIVRVTSGGAVSVPQASTGANKGVVLGFTAMPADVGTSTALYAFGNASSAVNLALGSGVNSSSPVALGAYKSRATDGSADVIVQSGDSILQLNGFGANGTTFSPAARIIMTVDGTPGASADMPGAIDFQTSPDGAATTASVLKLGQDKAATFGGDQVFSVTNSALRSSLADGADNFALYLTAGGAINTSGTRGALIELQGNEAGSTGRVIVQSGNAAGTATFGTRGVGDIIFMNNALTRWTINSSGDISQDGTNGGSLIFNKATADIRQGTSDGTDNGVLNFSGGGSSSTARGAVINLGGNESGIAGSIALTSGNINNNNIDMQLGGTNGSVRVRNQAGSAITILNTAGNITSAGTSDIGWSVVAGANTACNTTCTFACVSGFDSGNSNIPVACSSALADVCICAGAS